MFEFSTVPPRGIGLIAAILLAGGTLGGYAIHEHSVARAMVAENEQTTAALNQTRHELADLASKVNVLVARAEAQPAAAAGAPAASAPAANDSHSAAPRAHREDSRFKKLQSQLDAQNKAIDETRGDLALTTGELSGSIAHTHDELVVLQKRGERNYVEFDLSKSKQFEHKGPFGVRLKKANVKHQYADLELIVDDRNVSQKHVNLYQPVMFYMPDTPNPAEVVINSISKDHIHGYISSAKYRQSELASMSNATDEAVQNTDQPAPATDQPSQRKKLPLPQ